MGCVCCVSMLLSCVFFCSLGYVVFVVRSMILFFCVSLPYVQGTYSRLVDRLYSVIIVIPLLVATATTKTTSTRLHHHPLSSRTSRTSDRPRKTPSFGSKTSPTPSQTTRRSPGPRSTTRVSSPSRWENVRATVSSRLDSAVDAADGTSSSTAAVSAACGSSAAGLECCACYCCSVSSCVATLSTAHSGINSNSSSSNCCRTYCAPPSIPLLPPPPHTTPTKPNPTPLHPTPPHPNPTHATLRRKPAIGPRTRNVFEGEGVGHFARKRLRVIWVGFQRRRRSGGRGFGDGEAGEERQPALSGNPAAFCQEVHARTGRGGGGGAGGGL